jgi:CheY-like chemotaxis protein
MARILVLEDNVLLRYILAEWLRTDGFDVVEAASADEAVSILSSVIGVDLVITDV